MVGSVYAPRLRRSSGRGGMWGRSMLYRGVFFEEGINVGVYLTFEERLELGLGT